jgi:WD40 repeat protein
LWGIDSGKEIATIRYEGDVTSAAFSPDGKYIVLGSCDKQDSNQSCLAGSVRVQETSTGKEVTHILHDDRVFTATFSPDGKYVLSGSWDRTIRVWEALTGKEIAHIKDDEIVWFSAAFSPDGRYIVSDGCDKVNSRIICISGFIHVWEALTGKEVARMTQDDWVRSVAFSPDGKYIVSGSMDRTVRVWESATGKEITQMKHDDWVESVAFSPDGKYVVSGSIDKTARVWDAITGQEISRMTQDDGVTSVAFSPDGKYVVSGGYDKTARVWMWRPEDLIANACLHVTRNLSVAEWQQHVGNTLPYTPACPDLTTENKATLTPTVVSENSMAPTATLTLTKTPTNHLTPSVMDETLYQYTVQQRDTLISIAQKFNVPIEVIIQDNKLDDPNSLFIGQVLVIRITATATVGSPP